MTSGKQGWELRRDGVGILLFGLGAFFSVLVAYALARGGPSPTSGGTEALARLWTGALGGLPSLVLTGGAAFLGGRVFLLGRGDALVRHLLGVTGTALGLAAFLGALGGSAGGVVGEATGGLVARGLGRPVGVIFGLACLVVPAWFAWLRGGEWLSDFLRRRVETSEALRERHADGVTAAEAAMLIPRESAPAPTPHAETSAARPGPRAESVPSARPEPLAASQAVRYEPSWGQGVEEEEADELYEDDAYEEGSYEEDPYEEESFAGGPEDDGSDETLDDDEGSPAPEIPPFPYPEDVRLRGGIPPGTTPLVRDDGTTDDERAHPAASGRGSAAPRGRGDAGAVLGAGAHLAAPAERGSGEARPYDPHGSGGVFAGPGGDAGASVVERSPWEVDDGPAGADDAGGAADARWVRQRDADEREDDAESSADAGPRAAAAPYGTVVPPTGSDAEPEEDALPLPDLRPSWEQPDLFDPAPVVDVVEEEPADDEADDEAPLFRDHGAEPAALAASPVAEPELDEEELEDEELDEEELEEDEAAELDDDAEEDGEEYEDEEDEEEDPESAEYEEDSEEEEDDEEEDDEEEDPEAAEYDEEEYEDDGSAEEDEEEEDGEYEEAAEYEEGDEEEPDEEEEYEDAEEEGVWAEDDSEEEDSEEEDEDEEDPEAELEEDEELEEEPEPAEVAASADESGEPAVVLDPHASPAGEGGRKAPARPAAAPAAVERDWERLVHDSGCLFLDRGRVAVSMLQRHFDLDFEDACRVLDELQEQGLIGPFMGGQRRDILLTREQWLKRMAGRRTSPRA